MKPSELPRLHVSPRHDSLRPVRARRPHDRLRRGVAGRADPALLGERGAPRVGSDRAPRCRHLRDQRRRRAPDLPGPPLPDDPSQRRDPRARSPFGGRRARDSRKRPGGGLRTRRQEPRRHPRGGGKEPPRVPARNGSLRDRRVDEPRSRFPARRSGRLLRPHRPVGQPGNGRGRGPAGTQEDADADLQQRRRPHAGRPPETRSGISAGHGLGGDSVLAVTPAGKTRVVYRGRR